jgi:hypothetical protein
MEEANRFKNSLKESFLWHRKKERLVLPGTREVLLSRWFEHPASGIIHHEGPCCDEARAWFMAYARSMEIGSSDCALKAPTWLSKLFTWGPSQWPIAWCELVKEDVVDCGVFASLAREVFQAQGHRVHPAQVLLSYGKECTTHWKNLWKIKEEEVAEGKVFPWIGDEIVYHEICVLETESGDAKFYDSTWGLWLHPQQKLGHGAILAVRTECPRVLNWQGKKIVHGEWVSP